MYTILGDSLYDYVLYTLCVNRKLSACINLRCGVNLRSIIGHLRSYRPSATHQNEMSRPDDLHEDEDHLFIKDNCCLLDYEKPVHEAAYTGTHPHGHSHRGGITNNIAI